MERIKNKAEELVLKYLRVDNNAQEWFNTYIAKQCALIAVDEIIKECYRWTGQGNGQWENARLEYWEKVKYEINKL